MPKVSKKRQYSYGKPKRKLNSKFIILVSIILLALIGWLTIPKMISDAKLIELGYNAETLNYIYDYKLDKYLIKNEFYTDELNSNLQKENFDVKYLDLFSVKSEVSEDDLLLYNRLEDKGYSTEQNVNIFDQLQFFEITPLLVFDYQADENTYIQDCINNRFKNSETFFELDNTYRELYAETAPIPNVGDYSMNVSKTYYLPNDYVPEKLVPLSVVYASSGVTMENESAGQFMKMVDDAIASGYRMYASNAYRSYDYQTDLYNSYLAQDGQAKTDTYAARPGHSEHQTGLTIDVSSTKGGIADFSESAEYPWMVDNAHLYGFIQRYPNDKSLITGYREESWHWRYLGVDLATKVKESNLTFDEYYELYMK